MKDLGLLKSYLGIDFQYGSNFISMSQSRFIEKILEKFDMKDAKTKVLPCDAGMTMFNCSQSKLLENPTLFRAIIGSLVYINTCTRPEISYIVTRLSQYMDKPTKAHLALAKDVLRYLKGTIDQELIFYKSKNIVQLIGYCDSDYAGSDDRKSTSGYCFKLNEESALISWKTKKQKIVCLSSCEAEYVAMTHSIQEGKFLCKLLSDMQNTNLSKFSLFVDNQGAMKLAYNPINQQRSKHIDVKYHFIRSEIQCGAVELKYVQSCFNLGDMFTKALSRTKLDKFNFSG